MVHQENLDNQTENTENNQENQQSSSPENPKISEEVERLKQENGELKDKYLRLYADFENLRRRAAKEKLELIQTAEEKLIKDLLSVIDDFERAKKENDKTEADVKILKEGFNLIFNKFSKVIQQKGVKTMDCVGQEFNADLHEAITQIPAGEEMSNKVVDVVESGYYLNDKVIRYAKVVVGI